MTRLTTVTGTSFVVTETWPTVVRKLDDARHAYIKTKPPMLRLSSSEGRVAVDPLQVVEVEEMGPWKETGT